MSSSIEVGLYEGCKHALGTHLTSQGVQERHIQWLFGHADPRSTRRYAQLADVALVRGLKRPQRDP